MIISIKKEEKNEKEILQTSKESNLHRDVIGDGAEQYPMIPYTQAYAKGQTTMEELQALSRRQKMQ